MLILYEFSSYNSSYFSVYKKIVKMLKQTKRCGISCKNNVVSELLDFLPNNKSPHPDKTN